MESTAVGLVRGTVIVAFVLGLPAIALFGVPDEVRAFLESDFLPWNSPNPALRADEEHATNDMEAATLASDDHAHNYAAQRPSFFARTASTRADDDRDASDSPGSRIALASAEARVLHQPVYRPQPSDEPAEVVRHMPTDDVAGQGGRESGGDAAMVRDIEQRLQALGANRYQLQQASDGRFRFDCQCTNDRGEERTFEATAVERVQAMQAVYDQVVNWRNGEVFGFFSSGGR